MSENIVSHWRTAVVTGAASGIGLATADLLRERGYEVICVDLHDADVIADLSTQDGCDAMVAKVIELAGDQIEVVIANAGVLRPDALCYAVNYHGAVRALEGLRPLLARSRSPRVVVTASFAAANPGLEPLAAMLEEGRAPEGPLDDGAAYAISKHAICRWVRRAAFSPEWAGAGILVNAICPGLVDTPMQEEAKNNPAVLDLIKAIPLQRIAQPQELAHAFAFLVDERNTYISGQLLYVDGGLEAMMRHDRV